MQHNTINNESVQIKGYIKIIDYYTGKLLWENQNLIVNVGKQRLAEIISGTTSTAITEIGVGSNNTPPSTTQTDLLSPILWKTINEKTVSGASAIYRTYFLVGDANGTWRELGIRANTASNRLIARQVISDFTKTSSQAVIVEWTLTFI